MSRATIDQYKKKYPLCFAHRGGLALWPENTMLAFTECNKLAVDFLELDIHISKDGVIVISHDPSLNRMTNLSGNIEEMNYADVSLANAAYGFKSENGDFPFRGQKVDEGITMPRLEDLFAGLPEIGKNIDIKTRNPQILPEFNRLIKKYHQEEKVIVASFHDTMVQQFKELQPEMAYAASLRQSIFFFLTGKTRGFDILELPLQVSSRRLIKRAQKKNMPIASWTVNKEQDMVLQIKNGIDGIITDRPDLFIEVKAQFKK